MHCLVFLHFRIDMKNYTGLGETYLVVSGTVIGKDNIIFLPKISVLQINSRWIWPSGFFFHENRWANKVSLPLLLNSVQFLQYHFFCIHFYCVLFHLSSYKRTQNWETLHHSWTVRIRQKTWTSKVIVAFLNAALQSSLLLWSNWRLKKKLSARWWRKYLMAIPSRKEIKSKLLKRGLPRRKYWGR